MPLEEGTFGLSYQDMTRVVDGIQDSETQAGFDDQPRESALCLVKATATGGIPALSGSTMGSATCTKMDVDTATLTVGTDTLTVYNYTAAVIPQNKIFFAMRYGGVYIALPAIVDLQLDGTDLEHTTDNATWEVWHTGTECS